MASAVPQPLSSIATSTSLSLQCSTLPTRSMSTVCASIGKPTNAGSSGMPSDIDAVPLASGRNSDVTRTCSGAMRTAPNDWKPGTANGVVPVACSVIANMPRLPTAALGYATSKRAEAPMRAGWPTDTARPVCAQSGAINDAATNSDPRRECVGMRGARVQPSRLRQVAKAHHSSSERFRTSACGARAERVSFRILGARVGALCGYLFSFLDCVVQTDVCCANDMRVAHNADRNSRIPSSERDSAQHD